MFPGYMSPEKVKSAVGVSPQPSRAESTTEPTTSQIHSRSEQNEPNQGDIGETSNELTQAERNEFEELYASANEELYPGCDYVTRLDFMAKFIYFKVKGKKVPKKVLRYFSIIPRLQCLYKSSHTAKEMTWHAIGKCMEPGKMQHPVAGRAWKNFDTKYLNFAKELRNVRLGLTVDGFNPFGNLSQTYSMWPVILTTYNLSPWLCIKESPSMLALLIPGPKSPGKDINVYLRPLIDDLKVLWALKGVETIGVATSQKFNMRAMVLWTINDFPARISLSGWSGQGYKACPTCNKDTPSVRVLEDGDPPRKFDRDQIQAQLARLPMRVKGKHPSYGGVKIKRDVLVELNWTKRMIFYELKHRQGNARQDLKRLGIRSGLWLGQTKNEKCSKPQAAYSFTPENRKKFCQFIKGVKLPDGFGSNFKHKYLPDEVTKPIIELCLFFKQICSATLMEGDMLKAHSKVVDILRNLELIYPSAFFDIMIHLVIHLPLEALEGGPIHPRWMFPFERFMKKLKGYVRNKAKSEGSIAEGYVAEEALNFSSYYFRDVTMKFNQLDHNVGPFPQRVSFSPEIDTYQSQFKSKFPNKDMKEEFPDWFKSQIHQRHVGNDPGVSTTNELFALAYGQTRTPISFNSCIVNGVRFVMHNSDERRTTQNNSICSRGGKDGEMYYGQLQEILEFSYLSFKVVLFRVKWFDTSNEGRKVKHLVLIYNMTQILTKDIIDLDEDDDIINDEDALPHDLAYSDDEDIVNVDDDDGVDEPSPSHSKSSKPGKEHGRMPTGIPVTCSPSRSDGSNTPSGVPYTEEEINALARKGKQRGHLPAVGRVLSERATNVLIPPPSPPPQCTHNFGDVEKLKKKNKYLTKQVNLMMKLFRNNDKFLQMLNQSESTPEFGIANGSGGCGDDEMANDEDGGEDEEDVEDGDS
nr:hypothetical protein [Tanacetum cinerariifolium]